MLEVLEWLFSSVIVIVYFYWELSFCVRDAMRSIDGEGVSENGSFCDPVIALLACFANKFYFVLISDHCFPECLYLCQGWSCNSLYCWTRWGVGEFCWHMSRSVLLSLQNLFSMFILPRYIWVPEWSSSWFYAEGRCNHSLWVSGSDPGKER